MEVALANGFPQFTLVGLAGSEVREARVHPLWMNGPSHPGALKAKREAFESNRSVDSRTERQAEAPARVKLPAPSIAK